MSTSLQLEQESFRVATASIRRHSMNVGRWKHTTIGSLRPELSALVTLEANERVITSAFFDETSWYAFTTRRIISQLRGARTEIDPRHGIDYDVGNFKGIDPKGVSGTIPIEVGKVVSSLNDKILEFQFETANASMAPIYACIFWSRATRFHHPKPPSCAAASHGENDG